MMTYLLYCQYEEYCQGIEKVWGYFLIWADSPDEAKQKLLWERPEAKYIQNKTLG